MKLPNQKPETPGQVAQRLRIEGQCFDIGRTLAGALPPGHGFALLMFEFGDDGSLAYCSNGRREDMMKVVEEWLGRVGHDLAQQNHELRCRVTELEEQMSQLPQDDGNE